MTTTAFLSPAKPRVTVDQVKQAVARRIHAGVHPLGSKLPTVREFADELGANRNTVNKAYRQLCEAGVLELGPGGRSFVVGAHPPPQHAGAQFREQAVEVVWQAMAAGIPRESVLDDLSVVVERVYGAGRLRIPFIECNELETAELAADLAALVSEPIEPCLLDDAQRLARDVAERSDLIVTTFHHLAEVNRAFMRHADKVIGVDTRPSPETMLGIARIGGPRIGLVCTLDNTAASLRHFIQSYHPERAVEVALIGDDDAVRRVARACGSVAVTHTCVERYAALAHKQPDVVVRFRIDEQSITYLRQRIQRAKLRARMPGARIHTHESSGEDKWHPK